MSEAGVLDPGLQRERTSMAWTRTVLGVLGNGALVVLRHERSLSVSVTAVLAVLALLVAAAVLAQGLRRARIESMPDRMIRPAFGPVVSVGVLVSILCIATFAALVAAT